MAEFTIDKIEYDGNIYHLQDANPLVGIDSTWKENDSEIVLTVGSLGDADITRY